MYLQFPNRSRSYSPSRHRIQFWGYDSALEVSFFLETDALARIDPGGGLDEAAALQAFDANRARIERAAERVYSRHAQGSYLLTADDL